MKGHRTPETIQNAVFVDWVRRAIGLESIPDTLPEVGGVPDYGAMPEHRTGFEMDTGCRRVGPGGARFMWDLTPL